MTNKTSRRPTKRRARLHRMSAREQACAIEAIYSTSKRSFEIVSAAWEYLSVSKCAPGAIGIVQAVLNRQMIELGYVANQSKRLAEGVGLAVQS